MWAPSSCSSSSSIRNQRRLARFVLRGVTDDVLAFLRCKAQTDECLPSQRNAFSSVVKSGIKLRLSVSFFIFVSFSVLLSIAVCIYLSVRFCLSLYLLASVSFAIYVYASGTVSLSVKSRDL